MNEQDTPGGDDRRPTPVRMAMEGPEAEQEEAQSEDRVVTDPERGEDWVVRVSGQSSSGILPLRVISLLEIAFSRVGEPEKPIRRALCQGESLDELKDEDLLRLLTESRPYDPVDLQDGRKSGRNPRSRPRQGRNQ